MADLPEPLKCPACGARLEAPDAPFITCQYCGNTMPVPAKYRPQPGAPAGRKARPLGCAPAGGLIALGILVLLVSVALLLSLLAGREALPSDAQPVLGLTPLSPTALAQGAQIVLEFGEEGTGAGQFQDPRSIAVDRDGNIFVGDYGDQRVQKFDPTGRFLYVINVAPDEKKPFIYDIAVDFTGHVYALAKGDIYQYDGATGKLSGTIPHTFPDTYFEALAVDPSNTLYAFSSSASYDDILKLDTSGTVLAHWDHVVTSVDDNIGIPSLTLAVDGLGTVYAAEESSSQIFLYDKNGKYLNRFGEKGDEPGQLDRPGAIDLDGHGHLYVSGSGRIDILTLNGRFVARIPVDYAKGGIRSIALDGQGLIYAVTSSGKVLKYRLSQPLEEGK